MELRTPTADPIADIIEAQLEIECASDLAGWNSVPEVVMAPEAVVVRSMSLVTAVRPHASSPLTGLWCVILHPLSPHC